MGLWQRFLAFFKGGPSKEELARQEQLRREKEAALQQQVLMAQQLKAVQEESRRRQAEIAAERERHQNELDAARNEDEGRQKVSEAALEKKFKAKEKELATKFTELLEDVESKLGQTIQEQEQSVDAREAELEEELEAILAEKDEELETTKEEKGLMEDELGMLVIEKEIMEQEAEKLKEKEESLARRTEELRIARKKAKFGERPGLGMTKEERSNLETVLGTYTFDNFVVGPNNRFPREAALTVAREPANAYNPLFIYSPVGLGKTHLLSAIGNYIVDNHKNLRVAYLTTERFTNELLKAVANNAIEEFRTQYRELDVLLIDDIQFLGRQEQTQTEFFHTFNTLYNDHKQIVLASDRPPREIATLESRLQSRFEGGLITAMKPPELTTRKHILVEKAKEEGLEVSEDVIDFLAQRITSNIRTLLGALNRVTAYCSLTGEPCSTAMASEVLKDMLGEEAAA